MIVEIDYTMLIVHTFCTAESVLAKISLAGLDYIWILSSQLPLQDVQYQQNIYI